MRRPLTVLAFVVCSLAAFPSRADAYFWDWLDDLSGPSFWGVTLEIRVWCGLEDAQQNRGYLTSVRGSVRAARERYSLAASVASGQRQQFLQQAEQLAGRSLESLDKAIGLLDVEMGVDDLVVHSLYLRALADDYFERGQRLADGIPGSVPPLPSEAELTATRLSDAKLDTGPQGALGVTAAVAGGTVSICKTLPFERQSQFVTVNLGWGWDKEKAGVDHGNRMFTLGASYHKVFTPYFTAGGGGGLARFTADGRDPVYKGFAQGFVDFRPLALRRNSQLRGPWWHVPFIRYGVITFPGGFENGSFAGQTEAYGTEFIQTIGVYFDTEPVIRRWRRKW